MTSSVARCGRRLSGRTAISCAQHADVNMARLVTKSSTQVGTAPEQDSFAEVTVKDVRKIIGILPRLE